MTQPSRRKRILGYTDKLTVRPGESIELKVSVEGGMPYTAQLVRLINGDIHSTAANYKEIEIESPINGVYQGRQQKVAPGSCIVIGDVHPLDSMFELTLAIHFMPTMPRHGMEQHLISRWDSCSRTGWSLHLNENGRLAFTAADDRGLVTTLAIDRPLKAKTWYAVVLSISWRSRTVQLHCRSIAAVPCEMDLMSGSAVSEGLGEVSGLLCPLLMAAAFAGRDALGRVIPSGCFNGRLEAPVIYRGLLSNNEIDELLDAHRPSSLISRTAADWDFSADISGTRIMDCSVNQLHGHTHNLPLRAVKGTRWNGRTMEWQRAPDHYAAIHFHDDDLYDCGWLTDSTLQVPGNLRSGIYALRIRVNGISASLADEDCVPFFVAAPKGAPQAQIAFIVPTFTYLAYGNFHIIEVIRKNAGRSEQDFYASPIMMGPGTKEYSLLAEEHYELGCSTYDRHKDGSPVHFSSWLRPLLNVRPKSILNTLCADLLLTDWLETKGFDYDVITDDLLQEEGVSLLRNYRVVITGNHPEYPTAEQLDAIESYLSQGGRLMYMGGNGYYWRSAVHKALPGAIEVRRGRTGTTMWQSDVGESCLAFTGEMGGIWRDLGRPPQRLVGVGFIAEGSGATHYRVVPEARQGRAAFILEGVESEVVGDFGIFEGGAVAQEFDKTNMSHGTPIHAIVVARSENHDRRMIYAIEEMKPTNPGSDLYRSLTFAEVVFFETPKGGAVFSVGSMAWCGSLSHNDYQNSISTMTGNVLVRFADAEPFIGECNK